MKWSKCWKLPPFPWLEETQSNSRLRFNYGNGLCCADPEAGCAAFWLGGHTNTSCIQVQRFLQILKEKNPFQSHRSPTWRRSGSESENSPGGFFTGRALCQQQACPSLRDHEALEPKGFKYWLAQRDGGNVQLEIFTMFVLALRSNGNGKKIQGIFTRLQSLKASHPL